MSNVMIGHRAVGENSPPFIIAELSGNHNQCLDTALAMVEAAAMFQVVAGHKVNASVATRDVAERLVDAQFHAGLDFASDALAVFGVRAQFIACLPRGATTVAEDVVVTMPTLNSVDITFS